MNKRLPATRIFLGILTIFWRCPHRLENVMHLKMIKWRACCRVWGVPMRVAFRFAAFCWYQWNQSWRILLSHLQEREKRVFSGFKWKENENNLFSFDTTTSVNFFFNSFEIYTSILEMWVSSQFLELNWPIMFPCVQYFSKSLRR